MATSSRDFAQLAENVIRRGNMTPQNQGISTGWHADRLRPCVPNNTPATEQCQIKSELIHTCHPLIDSTYASSGEIKFTST